MTIHASVPRNEAQAAIEWLRANKLIDDSFRIQNTGSKVLIPLKTPSLGKPPFEVEIEDMVGKKRENRNKPVSARASFDHLGSVAILKIRDANRAMEVADSILQTNTSIRSVYLDRGITGRERVRNLTLLAGEENYLVTHRENGLRFMFDIREVYFSPRLATERLLLSKRCDENERILDMFSGIGPFAITIAKLAGSSVRCFDLNERCIYWLGKNASLNGVTEKISMEAGDSGTLIESEGKFDRIIMNLPHSAGEFLSSAMKHLKPGGVINYYEISNSVELEKRMEQIRDLGLVISRKRIVHGYAPGVYMHSLELALNHGIKPSIFNEDSN